MIGEMSILMLLLITATFISVIWVIRSFIIYDEDLITVSIVVTILIGVFGWGLIGAFVPVRSENYFLDMNDVSVEKTNSIILVNSPFGVFVYDRKVDFDNINDSTQFSRKTNFNMYGVSVNHHMIYYYTKSRVKQFGIKLK